VAEFQGLIALRTAPEFLKVKELAINEYTAFDCGWINVEDSGGFFGAWVDGRSVYKISDNRGTARFLNVTVQGPRPTAAYGPNANDRGA
jgi:hypothetical protein